MFEARLARNLRGSPKYWLFFQSDLHVFRRTVRYLPQLAVFLRNWNNSTHACRKPWRAWKKTLEILRGSNVGGTVLKCILGPLGCYVLMKHFIQFTGLGESLMGFCRFWKINGIFVDIFNCINRFVAFSSTKSRRWFQICCLVLDFGYFSTFQASLRRFLPIWMPPTHLVLSLKYQADHQCMVHLRKLTWTPNITIVE